MTRVTTIRDRVVSVLIWLVAGSFLVVTTTFLSVLYRFIEPDRFPFLDRFYAKWQIALTFNKQIHHVHPDVDPDVQYIFVQNHTSHLDHVAIYNATPHFKQGVELESHFRYPFYGWFMKARGTIPVPSGENTGLRSVLRGVREQLAMNRSILAFPEGHRTLDGHVGEFQDGLFYIAIKLQAPIVPVAVTGLYEVLHKGSLVIRPGQEIVVYVEEPIATKGLTLSDVPKVRDRVRAVISARVEAHMRQRANA